MIHFARARRWLWLLILALALPATSARAQDEDAFGNEGDTEMPAETPAKKNEPKQAEGDKKRRREEEPAVLAILESNPTTPAELVHAVEILVDLRRPTLAKPLLKKLLEANLDEKALAELSSRFGSGVFLKLTRNKKLQPEGAKLADAVLAGADAYQRNPKNLAGWVAQLGDANEEVRLQAVVELQRAHSAAVAPLIGVLADPRRAAQHLNAQTMLVRLGAEAVDPLLGVLDSGNAPLMAQTIDVLGRIKGPQAVPYLVGRYAASSGEPDVKQAAGQALARLTGHTPLLLEAQKLLADDTREQLDHARLWSVDAENKATLWHWDPAKKASLPTEYRAADAALQKAARMSHDLVELNPNEPANRRLYLTALLESAKYSEGLDKPLAAGADTPAGKAAAFGPAAIDDLLADALANNHVAAATAAAEILGAIGRPDMLVRSGAKPCALVVAARHPDRRLRFAAVNAILQLKPTAPFAGSSCVPEALGYFAGSYGSRRALIGHPRIEEGQKMVGILAAMGYEADLAPDSRRCIELAIGSPDYEFALVHLFIDHPPADILLKQLRRDPRTASLPVGLLTVVENGDRARRLAAADGLAEAFPQPPDEAAMKLQLGQLLAHAGRHLVSPEERMREAAAALDWLSALSAKPQTLYDLRRQLPAVQRALQVPELTAKAAVVLGNLGTADGQQALLDLVNRSAQPLELRQSAAAAFDRSVYRHGILLTTAQIGRQYDIYNASRHQDEATQQVLALVLDAIEQRGGRK